MRFRFPVLWDTTKRPGCRAGTCAHRRGPKQCGPSIRGLIVTRLERERPKPQQFRKGSEPAARRGTSPLPDIRDKASELWAKAAGRGSRKSHPRRAGRRLEDPGRVGLPHGGPSSPSRPASTLGSVSWVPSFVLLPSSAGLNLFAPRETVVPVLAKTTNTADPGIRQPSDRG